MSGPRRWPPAERRRRDLAAIHAGKKQLGLDDDTYRALVERVSAAAGAPGIRSSAELSDKARRDLVEEMKRLGAGKPGASKPGQFPGRPNDIVDGDMMTRVEQLLTAMQLPWSYADQIAKHMYRIERVAWVRTMDQMRGIIAALDAEHKRRELRHGIDQAMEKLGITHEQIGAPKNWRSNLKLLQFVAGRLLMIASERGVVLDEPT